MTEILLVKTMGGAKAADESAHRVMSNIPNGLEFVADVRDPRRRSTKQHRFWFKILSLIFDNSEAIQEQCGDDDNFRKMLTIELGHFHSIKMRNGDVQKIAKSVAFHNMEQQEFNNLVSGTLDWASVFGFSPADLLSEAENATGYNFKNDTK